jgi:3-oxoacyl-[acyl-carrier protein] reductase
MKDETRVLAGKVAIVSGGSGAIGRAILQAFEQAGARPVSLDLCEPGDKRAWAKCDVREESSVVAAVQSIYKSEGRPDFVVHAAGISRDSVVWKMSAEDWDSVQAVNLRGAFLLLRQCVPLMRHGAGGRVVLVGSINGSRGKFGTSAYSASKTGLIGLAKSVAREVGRFGILINVVEPGWVRTPMTEVVPQAVKGNLSRTGRCRRISCVSVRAWSHAHNRSGPSCGLRTVSRGQLRWPLTQRFVAEALKLGGYSHEGQHI